MESKTNTTVDAKQNCSPFQPTDFDRDANGFKNVGEPVRRPLKVAKEFRFQAYTEVLSKLLEIGI
jgi:hypothetical protein